ncbi:MAG: M20 family metallopeptidase [Tepidimonas sp.]|nr:M20 family metallopeptidase [Tepidimonas sp.]
MKLIEPIVAQAERFVALRRDLHAHPELGFEEVRTAERVATLLGEWGVEVHRGLGRTGVVGVVHGRDGGACGRMVGLRADMDALPMTELNTFAHASRHPGRMHACGHDGHTAMLLAAAEHLARTRDFDGTVVLIFQPAEEGGGGARAMIADGLFERWPVQAVFGLHNWPGLPVGHVAVSPGPVMASSNECRVVLRGKGGHAALPHLATDPVPAACQLVLAWQTILTRNLKPIEPAVLSVTMLRAGEATNVIPDHVELQGTVRTFSVEALDQIEARMRELAEGVAAAYGLQADFTLRRNYPPTVNHAAEAQWVADVARELLGPDAVHPQEPTLGAEDFAYMLQARPGAYLFLGNGNGQHRAAHGPGHDAGPCTLHHPRYDFNDALIPLGASLWVRLAQRWLAQGR